MVAHEGEYLKDNLPALVDEDVFWFAFYIISDVDPDGTENMRKNSKKRYNREGKPEAPALLKDIIETNAEKKAVYTGYRFTDWYYIIMWRNNTIEPVASKHSVLVDHVDQAFQTALLAHMVMHQTLQVFEKSHRKHRSKLQKRKRKHRKI